MNTIRIVDGIRLVMKPLTTNFFIINEKNGDISEKLDIDDVKNALNITNLHDIPKISDLEFKEKLEKKLD